MTGPRILVIDIETSPVEVYVWGLWEQNIGIDYIKTEWTILSFAAKWLGEKRVISANTGGRGPGKTRDDKPLMGEIWRLLDEADIVIAQNGKRFDVRKMNARLIAHGYPPPSPYRVIDTMVEAKKYFAFTSQKLKWTSALLSTRPKEEHKEYPGFALWTECLADNPRAWKVMARYNKRDILATEDVYLKLRPWINNHPNVSAFSDSQKPSCPRCGSAHVERSGIRHSVKQQGAYIRYHCRDCGGWTRGKTMQLPLEKRRNMLVPE